MAATNLMITSKGPIFLADTSININPKYNELGYIANMAAETAKMFGFQPVVAMLSYSILVQVIINGKQSGFCG